MATNARPTSSSTSRPSIDHYVLIPRKHFFFVIARYSPTFFFYSRGAHYITACALFRNSTYTNATWDREGGEGEVDHPLEVRPEQLAGSSL